MVGELEFCSGGRELVVGRGDRGRTKADEGVDGGLAAAADS